MPSFEHPMAGESAREMDSQEVTAADLFYRMKKSEEEVAFLRAQETYLDEEIDNLRRELSVAREELQRVQAVPLQVTTFLEMVDDEHAIVTSGHNGQAYVRVASTVDRELLKPSTAVACRQTSHSVVRILPPDTENAVQVVSGDDRPKETYADIGGLDAQIQEIREAVELPLTHADLYRQIGIDPPRGCLLYGPPGTGKTLAAKAVAHHTSATFIRVNGSEFVQKYLGEGPRMVRDVFRVAREQAPSIIFLDECDAVCQKRFDANTGGDREVQRILIELLNQLDGFDQDTDVKVIMATNRADTLDPALTRPGRLDRKIEFPYPDRRQRRLIFRVCTQKMALDPKLDLEIFVARPERLSGADIAAICLEAGMQAVRHNRYVVTEADMEAAFGYVVKLKTNEQEVYL